MKCKDCDCCKQGWFKSMPSNYVCTGVKEPFVIDNIYNECTEYPEKRSDKNIGDDLMNICEKEINMTSDDVAALLVDLYGEYMVSIGGYENDKNKMYAKAVGIAIRMLTD